MPNSSFQSPVFPLEEEKKSNLTNLKKTKTITSSPMGGSEKAQYNITFFTLLCSFFVGVILSICVCINYWHFKDSKSTIIFTDELKSVWGIVIPIITLTLGYALGKNNTSIKA